jgi:hypothetical protein
MKNQFTALLFLGLINYASAQNTFPASGNVGIGTLTPGSLLEVVGRASTGIRLNGTSNDFEALSIYNTTQTNLAQGNGAIIQFYNNAANTNTVYGASIKSVSVNNQYGWESDLYLRTTRNNSYSSQTILNALVVKGNSGNVGIGTTAPGSYKLAVAGSIGAWGEVRVFTNGSAFPDYVFDPSYKLPTLEETEKYVKENRHLPEVPSAAEIEKEGMSLNGMNVILLKKVEELTLHLIEMKKEIEELKKIQKNK